MVSDKECLLPTAEEFLLQDVPKEEKNSPPLMSRSI